MALSTFYYSDREPTTSSNTTITFDDYANQSTLTEVNIGDGVTSIDSYAFFGCANLTSITFPTGSLTSIGEGAFFLTKLVTVTIPNSVTGMGESIFVGCNSLTGVTLPINETIKSVPQGTFVRCTGLRSITIPSNYTEISQDAFIFAGLKTVTLNEGLQDIGIQAFYNCRFENTLTIPDSVTILRERAFEATGPSSTAIQFNMIIGTGVRDILSHCFYNSNVTNITFKSPSSLDSIGPGTFYSCDRLTTLYLPDSVTKIIAQSMDPDNCGVYADPPFFFGIGGRGFGNRDFRSNSTLKIGDNFIYPPVYIADGNKISGVCVPTYASGSLDKLGDILGGIFCHNVIFGKSVTSLVSGSFYNNTFWSGYSMTFEGKMSSIAANTFTSQGYNNQQKPRSGNLIFNDFSDSFILEDKAFNFQDKITIIPKTTIRVN